MSIPEIPELSELSELSGLTGSFAGSVLVTRDGTPLLRASAGLADRGSGVAATPETRYQIASVSKQFTAAAVLLLVEDGALRLDQPIGSLWPDCARSWQALTLHHLLSHTAGLGHWTDLPGFDVTAPGTPEEFLERFAAVPLLSEPGTAWSYSSPGFLIAARVVEAVSGTAYGDLLTERVLGPAGMRDTVVGHPPAEPRAWGYRGGERVDVPEFAAVPGTGDVWSTVDDLARWPVALAEGAVLGAASRRAMTSPQARLGQPSVPDDPAPAEAYGYGLFLGSVCGRPARFHPGDNPGYQSFLGTLTEADATVVVLANDEECDLDAVLRAIGPLLG